MCAGKGAAAKVPVHTDVGSSPSANCNINGMNITLQSRRCTFSLEERVHLMAAGQKNYLIALLGTVCVMPFSIWTKAHTKLCGKGKKYYTVEVSVEDGDIKLSHFLMIYEP